MKAALLSFLRHILTYAAGYVAAKGWLDEGTANEVATAVVVIIAAGWSSLERRKEANRAIAAQAQSEARDAGDMAVERDRAAGGAERSLRDGAF